MGRKPKQPVQRAELSVVQRNLQRFRVAKGLTQYELDDRTSSLGGRGRTQKYESGEAEPPAQFIALASVVLGVHPVDFKREDDDSLPDVEVPHWGRVPCGDWERPANEPETRPVPGRVARMGDVVTVTAAGPSMSPRIREGQTVGVLLTPQYSDGIMALIHNQDGELSLKQIRRMPGGWEFHSMNPEYPPITADKVTMLGRVVYIPPIIDSEGIAA
jgi:SOS-response transcriptional repressor LexA